MKKTRSLLIRFDEDWIPKGFIIADTDEDEAKLREIFVKMTEAVKEKPEDEA